MEDERSEDTLAQLPHGLKEGADGEKKRGVFTGDTLFISGCGRFFEGQAEDMHRALNVVLRQLPLDTLVYCGHEYTASNVAFSAAVLPHAPGIQRLVSDVRAGRNGGVTTGLYTLSDELQHNPFMMVEDADTQKAIGGTDAITTMHALREAKNQGTLRIRL